MAQKTNAMRILDKQKINYQIHTYSAQDGIDGVSVANKIHKNINEVYKTLVTSSKNQYYVFCIPVNEELDLKKAAKAVQEKSVEMIPQKQLLPLTGYLHGGCSPFGMKKQFPTIINNTIEEISTVCVSGGKIGINLELTSKDLIESTNGLVADVIKKR